MKPYEKFLATKIQELNRLKDEIDNLPSTNLIDLPRQLISSLLSPNRIEDIRKRVEKLRGQTKAALDTWSRADREEDDPTYLASLIELVTEVDMLEASLSKKDLRQVIRDLDHKQEEPSERAHEGKKKGSLDG